MFGMYHRLNARSKGIVQILLGLMVVLYIFSVLPWWMAFVSGLVMIVHGCVTAGFDEPLRKAIQQANKKH
jgi:hypothetical protein